MVLDLIDQWPQQLHVSQPLRLIIDVVADDLGLLLCELKPLAVDDVIVSEYLFYVFHLIYLWCVVILVGGN